MRNFIEAKSRRRSGQVHIGATTITESSILTGAPVIFSLSAAADENILKAKIFRARERKIIGGD